MQGTPLICSSNRWAAGCDRQSFLPPRQREGKDFPSQPVLLEGRMPEAPGGCLVENNMPMDYAFP